MVLSVLYSTILLLVGCGLFYAAVLSYRQRWSVAFLVLVALGAFFVLLGLPQTRGVLGTAVWASFVTSLEVTSQRISGLHQAIELLRQGIENDDIQRREQQAELDQMQKGIRRMQRKLARTHSGVLQQRQALADLDAIVKRVYQARSFVSVALTQGPRFAPVQILEHHPELASIYILLDHVPILQSVEITFNGGVLGRGLFQVESNLITMLWRGPVRDLVNGSMGIASARDPDTTSSYGQLERRRGRVYVDGTPFPYLDPELDPGLADMFSSKWHDFVAQLLDEGVPGFTSYTQEELLSTVREFETRADLAWAERARVDIGSVLGGDGVRPTSAGPLGPGMPLSHLRELFPVSGPLHDLRVSKGLYVVPLEEGPFYEAWCRFRGEEEGVTAPGDEVVYQVEFLCEDRRVHGRVAEMLLKKLGPPDAGWPLVGDWVWSRVDGVEVALSLSCHLVLALPGRRVPLI